MVPPLSISDHSPLVPSYPVTFNFKNRRYKQGDNLTSVLGFMVGYSMS